MRWRLTALASPAQVAAALAQSPDVAMAEAQPMYELQAIPKRASPDDTYYSSSQANLKHMKLEAAWDLTKGDSGDVVIAIVDGGVEISHEDLSPTLWTNPGETDGNLVDDDGNGYVDDINGWNFRSDVANPTPSSTAEYHGTQVAGTANAATDNAKGIAGVAWERSHHGYPCRLPQQCPLDLLQCQRHHLRIHQRCRRHQPELRAGLLLGRRA